LYVDEKSGETGGIFGGRWKYPPEKAEALELSLLKPQQLILIKEIPQNKKGEIVRIKTTKRESLL